MLTEHALTKMAKVMNQDGCLLHRSYRAAQVMELREKQLITAHTLVIVAENNIARWLQQHNLVTFSQCCLERHYRFLVH